MGLLPPAPTRRMFSLPHGSGTRPRMPCASTAARGTWSGCASSTWWPRTTATCRSRPCTAAGATTWAYRSATGSGLGSRCTIGLRHLAMRRRPRELWRLSASQGGWTAGASGIWYVHGGMDPMGQRASAAVAGRRAVSSRHAFVLCASRLLSSACKFVHKGPVSRAIGKLSRIVRRSSSPPLADAFDSRQGWRGATGMERAVLPARTLRMTRHRRTTTSAGPPNGRGRGRSATEAGAGSGGSGIAASASGIGIARNGARPRRAAPARPGGLDRPGAVRPAGTRERTGASVSASGRVDPSDTTPSATAMRAAGRRGWPLRLSVPSPPTCAASARSFGGMAS